MSDRGLVFGAVHRPVTTTMVMVAVLLFGLVALTRLPVSLLPDLSYPSVTIRSEYVDAAPSEVEELITRPVEELVGAVPGVVRVESVSREGLSEVVLDFGWGTDIDRSLDDVREKLDRAVLPTGALRPVVLRYDPAQEPILRLALVGAPHVDQGAPVLPVLDTLAPRLDAGTRHRFAQADVVEGHHRVRRQREAGPHLAELGRRFQQRDGEARCTEVHPRMLTRFASQRKGRVRSTMVQRSPGEIEG